jgi:hypothetical protein
VHLRVEAAQGSGELLRGDGKSRGKVRTRAFAAMGTRVDADIFPLVVPLVFDGRSSTGDAG